MPILAGMRDRASSSPRRIPAAAGPMDADAGDHYGCTISAAPNFALRACGAQDVRRRPGRARSRGTCTAILNGSERVQPATLKRFTDRFAPFNFDPQCDTAVVWHG